MKEKLLFALSSKEFLTGIAPSAHTDLGGLFLSADGVTSIYDPGGTASTQNGLLQPGPAPTDLTASTIVDTIIAGATGNVTTGRLWMLGDGGHLYQLLDNGSLSDLRSGTPITTPANGLEVWGPKTGTRLLYYFQKGQIGTWDLSGSYPTGWDDNGTAYTGLTSVFLHPTHKFVGNLYFGNGSKIGALTDDGTSTPVFSTNVLGFTTNLYVTALTDDGVYLVVALTSNLEGVNVFAENKIRFWDTSSSLWIREYEIRDPFIYALKHIGNLVYAFGQYGVYEVSFGGGVRKILSRSTGFGTAADLVLGYGASRAGIYNEALMFATDTTVDHFGKISPDLPNGYFKPFKIPSSVGTPSFIFTQFAVEGIYVATDGDKLYRYDFNGTTRETSVSAQTIYFNVQEKVQLTCIEVSFGEPLASGDSMNLQLKTDEDTAVKPTTGLTATYAADGVIRRKKVRFTGLTFEHVLSLVINFTAGAVKIKDIRGYGFVLPNTP